MNAILAVPRFVYGAAALAAIGAVLVVCVCASAILGYRDNEEPT